MIKKSHYNHFRMIFYWFFKKFAISSHKAKNMKSYGKAFLRCLAVRAVWEPGENITPGDYGIKMNDCFVKLGSVAEFGIKYEPPELIEDSIYEFSSKLNTNVNASASAKSLWVGEGVSAIEWKGGTGLYIGAKNSKLLTITNLGALAKAILTSRKWGFNWRLVRQVRILDKGIVALVRSSTSAGTLRLSNVKLLDETINAGLSTSALTASEFEYLREGVDGAVYVHCVRLKPFLTSGAAPLLDHELWYEDIYDDE